MAAEQGVAEAQFALGLLYYIGNGVPQDYAEAAGWFRKAAVQGNKDAKEALAWMERKEAVAPQSRMGWFAVRKICLTGK